MSRAIKRIPQNKESLGLSGWIDISERLELTVIELEQEISKLKKERLDDATKLLVVNDNFKALETKNKTLSEENEALKDKDSKAQETVLNLNNEITTLKDRILELESDNLLDSEDSIEELKTEIKNLKEAEVNNNITIDLLNEAKLVLTTKNRDLSLELENLKLAAYENDQKIALKDSEIKEVKQAKDAICQELATNKASLKEALKNSDGLSIDVKRLNEMYNALLENHKKVVKEKIDLETDLSLKGGEIQIMKEKGEKVPNKFDFSSTLYYDDSDSSMKGTFSKSGFEWDNNYLKLVGQQKSKNLEKTVSFNDTKQVRSYSSDENIEEYDNGPLTSIKFEEKERYSEPNSSSHIGSQKNFLYSNRTTRPTITFHQSDDKGNIRVNKLIKPLKEFSGRDKNKDIIEDWLYTANRILEASGITNDQNKIFHASNYLTDSALHYFQAYEKAGKFNTWEEFAGAMKRKYRPLDHEQNVREQLRSIKQTKGINDYIDDFRILMNRVNRMEEEDKIAYFIHGLQEDTERYVQLNNPKSLEETILIAENFERFKRRDDKRSNLNIFLAKKIYKKRLILRKELKIFLRITQKPTNIKVNLNFTKWTLILFLKVKT